MPGAQICRRLETQEDKSRLTPNLREAGCTETDTQKAAETYENEDGILVNDTCHGEWDMILDRMVFLFRKADESSCQKKNPYEDEHMKMLEEFAQKYGHFGEMLETAEEKEERMKTGAHVVHFPSEIPEYVDVDERYYAEEKKLEEYRNQCKEEAFQLFSEWFFHLWD